MSHEPSSSSPAPYTARDGLRWALAGLILTPLAWVSVTLILNSLNPYCGTPGDSGGCAMNVVAGAIFSALPGAGFAFIAGAMRATYWRRKP